MKAKYRRSLSALVPVCTLLAAPAAHAMVLNANDYAVGTNLTNAFPGITLEEVSNQTGVVGQITTSPLLVEADTEFGGHQLGAATAGLYGAGLDSNGFIALEIIFHGPTYSFTETHFTDSGDIVEAFDYNSEGGLIGQEQIYYVGGHCLRYDASAGMCYIGWKLTDQFYPAGSIVVVGSLSSAADITQINMLGLVPEPSSLALLGCGLLNLGIAILRRRRRSLDGVAV